MLDGSFIAYSMSYVYSRVAAYFCKILKGSLKYTGTDILLISLPIESFIIVQILTLTLGSLRQGKISLI